MTSLLMMMYENTKYKTGAPEGVKAQQLLETSHHWQHPTLEIAKALDIQNQSGGEKRVEIDACRTSSSLSEQKRFRQRRRVSNDKLSNENKVHDKGDNQKRTPFQDYEHARHKRNIRLCGIRIYESNPHSTPELARGWLLWD